jgi:tRNA G10  N-methylase Trm11
MEHEAAFVMANQARITSGMSVLDPYAGSGGLLLTAAVVGAAVTVGIEMDKRLRYAQLNSNFEQQQLPSLTALIHGDSATAAVQEQALQANGGRPFDVILTDPPYGKYHDAANISLTYRLGVVACGLLLILVCDC